MSARVAHGEDFGMRSRISDQLSLVVTRRNDLTVDDHQRTDGNIAVGNRQFCFGQRKPHEMLQVHTSTLVLPICCESSRGPLA